MHRPPWIVVAALTFAFAAPALADTATIGLVHSETGAAAPLGISQANGAQLAVDELNAAGAAFPLALSIKDDQSTPDGAKAAFNELLGAGANVILGPTLSSAAFVADPLAQAAGVPVIAISNTADGITAQGDYIFRASLAESRQIPAAVRIAVRKRKFKRPAMIVRTDQPFAVSGAKAFVTALKANHAPVVATAEYTGQPASFDALLATLAKKHPDALVLETLTEGPQLMMAARKIKAFRNVPFLGGNAFNSLGVIKAAGAAAEGLIVGAAWHPSEPAPASRRFVKAYRARFGTTPDQFAAAAYSALVVFEHALGRAGSLDEAKLRDLLAKTRNLATPLGSFTFDANRDTTAPGVVQVVRNGRFALLH